MNGIFTDIDATWYARNVTAVGQVPTNPYVASDRYQGKVLISDRNGQHIQFIQKRWFPVATTEDTLVYIDSRYAHRPDVLSVDYYNSPLYAWAIMAANDLRSVWQLEAGMYIKIPNLAEVLGGLR